MDPTKLRSILKTARVIMVYVLIVVVMLVAVASFNQSLLSVVMNVMTAMIFILVGVVAMESVTLSVIKAKKKGKKKTERSVKSLEDMRADKRSSGSINFKESNMSSVREDEEDWLEYALKVVSLYNKADVLAGLSELLVQYVGKENAMKFLHRDVDKESLEASYQSFKEAINREFIEEFKDDMDSVLRFSEKPVPTIKALIEMVARSFGEEKKDVVYTVMEKHISSYSSSR